MARSRTHSGRLIYYRQTGKWRLRRTQMWDNTGTPYEVAQIWREVGLLRGAPLAVISRGAWAIPVSARSTDWEVWVEGGPTGWTRRAGPFASLRQAFAAFLLLSF